MSGIIDFYNPSTADGLYGRVAVKSGVYSPPDGSPDLPYRVVVRETKGRAGSNALDTDSAQRTFLVEGEEDHRLARQGLEDCQIPINEFDGINRSLSSWTQDNLRSDQWEFTIDYSSTAPSLDAGTYSVSIDTGGAAILQTHALSENVFHLPADVPTTFDKAIDVQDGEIRGVERVIPALKIDVRARIATEYLGVASTPELKRDLRMQYAKTIASLTGFTNSTEMFDGEFEAGELLFIGATGEIVGENPSLTFKFIASKNLIDLDLAGITVSSKKGHEYLWIEYFDDIDTSSSRPTKKIRAVHVAKVYGEADLTQLKIGVLPT